MHEHEYYVKRKHIYHGYFSTDNSLQLEGAGCITNNNNGIGTESEKAIITRACDAANEEPSISHPASISMRVPSRATQ